MPLKFMTYKIKAFALTDIGLMREKNEDAYALIDERLNYVLADGMGGHLAGEVASKTAVDAFVEKSQSLKLKAKDLGVDEVKALIQEVNRTVFEKSLTNPSLKGMGTTLCALLFSSETVFAAHVGDSRIYRLRSGELEQLTNDHTLSNELIERARFEENNGKYKSMITKAIGTTPIVTPSVETFTPQIGDCYLMCTDGLSDYLSHAELEEILNRSIDINHCCCGLVEAAKAKGGQDNITVVLLQIEG